MPSLGDAEAVAVARDQRCALGDTITVKNGDAQRIKGINNILIQPAAPNMRAKSG